MHIEGVEFIPRILCFLEFFESNLSNSSNFSNNSSSHDTLGAISQSQLQPINTMTSYLLSSKVNFNTHQWTAAPKCVIEEAIALSRVESDDTQLPESVSQHFWQLKDSRLDVRHNAQNIAMY